MSNISFQFNLTITQGDDRPLRMVFDDDDGNAVDISTWDFFYTAKSAYADEDTSAIISLDPTDFTKSDSGSGTTDQIDATISVPAGTAAGTYYQDIQVKKADGSITTFGRGKLVVEEQVTVRTS